MGYATFGSWTYPSRFVSDRLLRLGLPFAVYTLLV